MVVVGRDDTCPERYQERVLMDKNNETLLPFSVCRVLFHTQIITISP